jgi:hypothetical protein
MLKPSRMVHAAALTLIASVAAVLTGIAPAHADRTIPPPVSGEVLAWKTNVGTVASDFKCMQVDQGRLDDLAPVDQFACQYGMNQQWRIGQATDDPNVFWVQNVRSAKCLDDYAYGTNQGNPIIQYNCLVGLNQQWRMIWSYNDGYAQFQNVYSGLCLSMDGFDTSNGRRFVQNPCYGFLNEKFTPILVG